MANVVGRIPVGADTRPLERDIQASLNKNYQLKGLNEKAFTQPLGRITGSVDEFRKSLDASNARVLAFGASAGAIFAVQKSFQALISTTIQVQKNLTDINSILGLSSKSLQSFGDQLFKVASQTGQSFETVSKAAVEFSRQGLGVEETLKRTRDALILTRLSGLDVVASTEALTATINSFNKVALDSTQIVNKLATVDAAFAVSSADLAEAIQRVGSSAESVGLNLDQLVALVTSVQQTTARGGSVIGNSLKTIFTRLERTEVLDQLEQLGIQVRNLDGSFRPAIDTLSQLAQRFDGLSDAQRANVAELVGGVFQINILKAALGDLGKQYSIYNSALNTSTNATDAAVKRNEQLNQTLSALVNKTTANLTKLAADVGNLTLAPAIEGILSNINAALESFNLADAQGPGEKIAKGFLEGIGNYISGPGLALIGAVVGKLFINLAKFSTQAVGQILDLNKGAQQQVELQQRINSILAQNPNLIQGILNKEISLLQVEQDILNVIKAQTIAREQSAKISATLATNLAARGVTTTGGKISARSGGFIPNFASQEMAEIYGAYLGGYKPGKISKMNIPGEGPVIYNQAEKVKKFPGMVQPAIIPPASSSAGQRYSQAFQEKLGFNPYAYAGYIPNFESRSDIIRANLNNLTPIRGTSTFQVGKTGLTVSRSEIERIRQRESKSNLQASKMTSDKIKDVSKIASILIPGFGGASVIPGPISPKGKAGEFAISNIPVFGLDRTRLEGDTTDDKANIREKIRQSIVTDTFNFINTLKPLGRNVNRAQIEAGLGKGGERGAYGAVNAAIGSAFEVGIKSALDYTAAESKIPDAGDFDVRGGKNLGNLKKLFGFSTLLADFKSTTSGGNLQSFAAKVYKELGAEAAFKKEATKAMKAFGGYIPNYSALYDSMRREVSAGISPSSIRVGQDSRLRNINNPLGLGVYNTKDEPRGLGEGIARYGNDILSARKAGASKGFIPNYVTNYGITRREEAAAKRNQERLNREIQGKGGISSNALLAASIGIPAAGGIVEQFLGEENTRGRAVARGASNIASFAATGAALGGPVGGAVGGLVGLVTTLNDLDKAANQEGIDKFLKLVEKSQESLNKMNDAFVQFNTITDKLSNSASLSAKDIEQLQAKLTTTLAVLPEDLRKQLIQAYGEGDVLKIQSIQTNALEVAQAKQAIAQYQAGVAEANAPATLGEWLSESFGFSGATQRREKTLKDKLNLSTTTTAVTQFGDATKTIGTLITDEFNSFYATEKKAGETFQEYADRYEKLVNQAIQNPKILQYVAEEAGKKIVAEAIKTGDPDKIAAAQQQATDLFKKYAELGPEAIKGARDAIKTLGARETRTADVEQFKDQLSRYLNEITTSIVSTNLAYTQAETEVDINLRKLQSTKNNLLENAKLFAGEFTQIDIESQFAEANANLEYQRNVLEINRRTREKIGPALFAETLSGLRGTNDPASRQFAEYLNTQLQSIQNTDLSKLPEKITQIIDEVNNQFTRNSALSEKTREAAKSFLQRLNEVLIKDLPETQADLVKLNALRKAEAEIRAKEIEARQKELRDRQTIAFAGGIESLRRNDFAQRTAQFTQNRYLLGSRIPTESGRGALGLFEELRQFGIGPQSVNPKLQEKIVAGQAANIQRFSQAYGLNVGPQEARDIAQKQFDALAKQEKSVEEILTEIKSITSKGLALNNSTILALNPSAKVPSQGGGFTGLNTLGGLSGLAPEATAFINQNAEQVLANQSLNEAQARITKLAQGDRDTGKVNVESATGVQVLEDQIRLLQQQYEGRQGINDLITQAVSFDKQILDTSLNYNASVETATLYNSQIRDIVKEIDAGHISIFEAQKRIEQIQNDIATGIERENKLITDQIDRRKDLKDLADGYLTSVEFANKELERQQNLARMPGYNGVQGIAVNFTNQMAYNGTQFFQDLNQAAVDVARNIQDSFSNAFQSFMNGTQTAGDAFKSFAIQILQQIQQISTQIATKLFFGALFNPLQGALMGGGGGGGGLGGLFGFSKGGFVKGYASGGFVDGGSGIKDDVPAMLSKGEYVLNKRAVRSIQQAYGMGFLSSLNQGSTMGMADGGSISQTLDNKYVVSGWENTQGLNTKDLAGGISALEAYIEQLKGENVVSPLLSNYALTDPTQRSNEERMQTEQDFYDYVAYLQDNLLQNKMTYVQARSAYEEQLQRYNQQQQQMLIGGFLSAAMTIGGGLLMGGMGGGGLGGIGGANPNAYAMPGGMGGQYSAAPGNFFAPGSAVRTVGNTGGGLGSLFSGNNMALLGLLGAGAIGAPFLISMLGGNQNQKRNTVSTTRSSSGLQVSNRFRFADGGMAGDDIPALLTGGEFVVNKNAVRKYGSGFFEKLNRGQVKGFADGGQVGTPFNAATNPINLDLENLVKAINDLQISIENQDTTGTTGGDTNNITIQINMEADGRTQENRQDDQQNDNQKNSNPKEKDKNIKEFTELIKQNVITTIIEQKRPGGLLSKTAP